MSRSWVEPDTGSLRDDLAALLRQLVDYVGTPETGRVFTSFVDAAAREPELRALLREVERDGRSRFERAIRRGIERGELPAGVDTRLMVDLLMSPFVYRLVVVQSAVRRTDVRPDGAPRAAQGVDTAVLKDDFAAVDSGDTARLVAMMHATAAAVVRAVRALAMEHSRIYTGERTHGRPLGGWNGVTAG